MHGYRTSAALFFTTSLFLVNCSGGDDDSTPAAGTGGTSMGAAGKGGSAGTTSGAGTTGASGTTGGAGKAAAGGSAGTGGAGGAGGAGQGGSGGVAAGQGGAGGAPLGGRGGMSSAGAAGKGSAGMSGAGGSAGSGAGGIGGMSGMSGSGSGAGGKGAGGSGGGGTMTLMAAGITEGGMFPAQNTCATTANDCPALTWTAGPSGTMSYAMILLDTSNSLNHWVMWDIPLDVLTLPAALDDMAMSTDVPGAKQKSFQGNGYTGPCPSGADHVYKFTVYALPVATLSGAMTSQQPAALAMAIMNANPLASASVSAHSTASMGN